MYQKKETFLKYEPYNLKKFNKEQNQNENFILRKNTNSKNSKSNLTGNRVDISVNINKLQHCKLI